MVSVLFLSFTLIFPIKQLQARELSELMTSQIR